MAEESSRTLRAIAVAAVSLVLAVTLAIGAYLGFRLWQRGKQRETCNHMLRIGRALEAHKADEGRYPVSAAIPVHEVLPALSDHVDEPLAGDDAWGHPLRYQSSGEHFLLVSRGRDGEIDLSDAGGKRRGVDVDLVMFDAKYWQWASGV
jgi:hypothetical protein